MKQAFTNTTNKKTAGKPLHLQAKKDVTMPMCRYGAACLYKKTCIYRHPEHQKQQPSGDSSDFQPKICLAFVAGYCQFGARCFDKHPSAEEVEEYKKILSTKPCKYGENCKTFNCLYSHPTPLESNLSAAAPEFIPQSVMDSVFPSNVPTYSMKAPKSTITPRGPKRKRKIPIELWVNDFERPENVYYIKDPMERFTLVNQVYATSRFVKTLSELQVKVVDLHFQTINSVRQVLAVVTPQIDKLKGTKTTGVWIITGTGHHVAENSHQKKQIEGEGVLFFHVRNYLEENQIAYEVGVDNSGKNGAFYLPIES